jgi:Domain of unknown function (DUF4424)
MTAGRCLASALAVTLILAFAPARANDSSAAMAAGGLELIKNDQVRMVSEVLRIAPRLVEVNYVFENTGSNDVTTPVAFPLPELDVASANFHPLNIPFGATNFVGFQVWIDGQEIKPDIEVRVFDTDREVTADLKRIGIDPVNPNLGDKSIVDKLRSLKLVDGARTVMRSPSGPPGSASIGRRRFPRASGWRCGTAIGLFMGISMFPATPVATADCSSRKSGGAPMMASGLPRPAYSDGSARKR